VNFVNIEVVCCVMLVADLLITLVIVKMTIVIIFLLHGFLTVTPTNIVVGRIDEVH